MENAGNIVKIAALILSPFAAWYMQYITRWSKGPFAVFDKIRETVFGVSVIHDHVLNSDIHTKTRDRFTAVGLLECSRCTLFWVGIIITVVLYYFPWGVVALGIMGAASLIDDRFG